MPTDTPNITSANDTAHLPQIAAPRNAGLPLDLNWVLSAQANTSAVERRTASLPARRSVKKAHQAAWLLRAVTCIDLTTLSGDDTARRVERLCAKARQPVAASVLDALAMPRITAGAVCVYHEMIAPAVAAPCKAAVFRWRLSPPAFPQVCPPCPCASPRLSTASPQVPPR